MGISPQDHELIVNEVDVFINSAASLNFNEPLKDALNTNYFGATRLMELAKQCKKVKVFTHVSTAYVNYNFQKGDVEEKIYDDTKEDVTVKVSKFINMDDQ